MKALEGQTANVWEEASPDAGLPGSNQGLSWETRMRLKPSDGLGFAVRWGHRFPYLGLIQFSAFLKKNLQPQESWGEPDMQVV